MRSHRDRSRKDEAREKGYRRAPLVEPAPTTTMQEGKGIIRNKLVNTLDLSHADVLIIHYTTRGIKVGGWERRMDIVYNVGGI
jgi:hypothetical protein